MAASSAVELGLHSHVLGCYGVRRRDYVVCTHTRESAFVTPRGSHAHVYSPHQGGGVAML